MPSTRKRIPFKSLDVSLLRCVTLGTFTVAGAGVDATHEGSPYPALSALNGCVLFLIKVDKSVPVLYRYSIKDPS